MRRVRHQVFDMHEGDDKRRIMTQSGKLFIAPMTTDCVLRPAKFLDVQLRQQRSTFSALATPGTWRERVSPLGVVLLPGHHRTAPQYYEMPIRRRLVGTLRYLCASPRRCEPAAALLAYLRIYLAVSIASGKVPALSMSPGCDQ